MSPSKNLLYFLAVILVSKASTEIKHIYILDGTPEVVLECNISNLENATVSWKNDGRDIKTAFDIFNEMLIFDSHTFRQEPNSSSLTLRGGYGRDLKRIIGLYKCYLDQEPHTLLASYKLSILPHTIRTLNLGKNHIVEEGSSIQLTCVLDNYLHPPARPLWYKSVYYGTNTYTNQWDPINGTQFSHQLHQISNHSFHLILTITNITLNNEGDYFCDRDSVTQHNRNDQRDWVRIKVWSKSIHVTKNTSSPPDVVTSYELEYCPGLSTISKRFFSGSKSPLTLHIGATAKLSCGLKPDGEHDLYWTWIRGNETFSPQHNQSGLGIRIWQSTIYRPTKTELVIKNVSVSDGGVYLCHSGQDLNLSLVQPFVLNVQVPRTRLTGQTIISEGASLHLSCITKSLIEPKAITWFRIGVDGTLHNFVGSRFTFEKPVDMGQGLSKHQFILSNVTKEDAGNYTCYPDNWEIATVQVTVQDSMSQDFSNEDSSNWKFPDPEKVSEFLSPWKGICPSATTFHSLFFNPSYPINVKVQLEKTAELKCSWNMAVDEITWNRPPNNEVPSTFARITVHETSKKNVKISTLKIRQVTPTDGGVYVCQAHVGGELPLSQNYNLNIIKPTTRMSRSTFELPNPGAGSTFNLTCEIRSLLNPTNVVWFRSTGKNPLPEELLAEKFPQTTACRSNGLFLSVLTMKEASIKDGGNYSCVTDDWETATVTVNVLENE